jgi:hypothetical protein
MLVAKTRMYETKESGWIQQAKGVCAGTTKSTHRRVRNAPHLGRARNRVRRARHGIARDFVAVKRLIASEFALKLAKDTTGGMMPRHQYY